MTETITSAGRRSVLLTTDCGAEMDDQWALAHLALSPGVRLTGVVTTHAPSLAHPAARTAARSANDVIDLLSLAARPPVVEGASTSLADRRPRPGRGAEFILECARNHTTLDPLVVLVLGAATDVATALLTDVSLGERIEIIAMAFDGWPAGGDQFNVRNDPLAWKILLGSTAPITVGDAEVAQRQLAMTRRRAQELIGDCGQVGAFLVRLLAEWLDAQPDLVQRVTGDANSWPVWDEVVVAHLLGLTTVSTYPRPDLRNDLGFDHPAVTGWSIDWITGIASDRLWLDLRQRLRAAQSA